ncbi:hypothetical protein FHX08_004925 [Rhizobium sp. BK529]|uniref:hypothetical protein n=1 Tax=unclassified Rhizobium TaxID=2613769 RepID=UPI00104805F1|nr:MULTISPECIES: hypothetical protein [unclassified Rhizobium]MBB3594521.1 hypothetical protein [Rhizobium sp. BK529]TCS02263.1 hypothetical protein EV281_105218 [Rhizobium sp. BK418]
MKSRIVLDRPRYPKIVYPLDHGYFEGTKAADGGGVDIRRCSQPEEHIVADVSTIDLRQQGRGGQAFIGCTVEESISSPASTTAVRSKER